MIHLLVFAIVGPALGFLVALAMDPISSGRPFELLPLGGYIIGLPFAYLFGIVPALVTGFCDWQAARKAERWTRVAIAFCIGYAVSFLSNPAFWNPHRVQVWQLFMFGLVGAIPAAVCSWIAAKLKSA